MVILLFSLLSTYSLNESLSKKEKAKRVILAQNMIEDTDPVLEYNFNLVRNKVSADSLIKNMLNNY